MKGTSFPGDYAPFVLGYQVTESLMDQATEELTSMFKGFIRSIKKKQEMESFS